MALTSCKSKKSYTDQLRTKNVQNERRNSKADSPNKGEKADLPAEPSKFIRFKIDSPTEYIETFAETAQLEMMGYGKRELAMKTNTHFGIKCHKGWEGDYDFHDDDEKGECFRKYNHPMYSFRDHSIFLTTRSRYAFLFNL